jgi:hypothetical protein
LPPWLISRTISCVIACPADQRVVAQTTVEIVIAVAAIERVRTVTARQRVIAASTRDRVTANRAYQHVGASISRDGLASRYTPVRIVTAKIRVAHIRPQQSYQSQRKGTAPRQDCLISRQPTQAIMTW